MSEILTEITRAVKRRKRAQARLDDVTGTLRWLVRKARKEGIPKTDIARAAGVSRPTVDKWLEAK